MDSDYMRATERSDISLLKDVSRGNAEFFAILLDRYIDIVSVTSFRVLCDRTDSEAVTVKVFVSLWYDVLDYDDRFSLRDWLLRKTCLYSRIRIMRRRILRIFGVQSDVFVKASPKVEDQDDYLTKLAWEVFCRATTHMSTLQCIVYALVALDGMSLETVSSITGMSRFRVELALKSAEDKVIHELRHYNRTEDYERYRNFLRKVAESLTDYDKLRTEIFGQIGIKIKNDYLCRY